MPQRVLALEVDAQEMKAAVLETTFRDYRVVGFYREPVAQGTDGLADQLRAFVQRHEIDPTTVLSSLPGDLVTWRTFYLPFRDRKRLDQTVPFELENQVAFGLDEIIVDYQVLYRDRSGCSILAALVQRRDLEAHLALLASAGLDPKVVGIEPLATLNVVGLLGADLPDTFVYIGGDLRRLVVALYRNRQLVGLRTVVHPLSASHAETEAAAGNGHSAPAPENLTALVGEIRWTVLAVNGAPLDDGMPCVIGGDGPQFEQLARELSNATTMATRPLDLSVARNVPAELQPEITTFAAPLGLALREVSPNSALGVNFRQGEFAYHRAQDELRRALWRTGALAALVVLLMTTHAYMEYRLAASRLGMVEGQIRHVFSQTLPDVHRVTDARAQLQAEIEAAQKKLQILGGLTTAGGVTAIDILRTITAAVPANVTLDVDEYVMEPEGVRMKVKTTSFDVADAIKQQLLNTHYFADVQVKDVKSAPDGKVDFRLVLSLSREGAGATSAAAPR